MKRVGQGIGLNLKAVRTYTRQLLQALLVLHQLGIVHCDIKPDNILVSSDHSSIRLCDFGTAMDSCHGMPVDPTPYLASRFYRAPEISIFHVLGLVLGQIPLDGKLDLWALGCTIYELFTGSILFPGNSNNDMLSWMMMYKGKFPPKMLHRCANAAAHFNEFDHWAYLHQVQDTVTHAVTFFYHCFVESYSDRISNTHGD